MILHTSRTLAQAQTIMAEALRLGRAVNMLPLTTGILDAAGQVMPVVFLGGVLGPIFYALGG